MHQVAINAPVAMQALSVTGIQTQLPVISAVSVPRLVPMAAPMPTQAPARALLGCLMPQPRRRRVALDRSRRRPATALSRRLDFAGAAEIAGRPAGGCRWLRIRQPEALQYRWRRVWGHHQRVPLLGGFLCEVESRCGVTVGEKIEQELSCAASGRVWQLRELGAFG